jgi:hypothetical protein
MTDKPKYPKKIRSGRSTATNIIELDAMQFDMKVPSGQARRIQPWCGEGVVLDDGFFLICEREIHVPNADQDDKSPHRGSYKGRTYEWGPDTEEWPQQTDHPYNFSASENGTYPFSYLSGRDIGKWIEFDQGAKTLSGKIISINFFLDTQAQKKARKRAQKGQPLDEDKNDTFMRCWVLVSRNGDVQDFRARLTDEFRMYYQERFSGA